MLETTENAVYPLFFPFCFSFLPFISSSMPGKPRPPHRLYHTRVTLFSYTPVSRRFFSFFFFYFFFFPLLFYPRDFREFCPADDAPSQGASIFQETREIGGILKIGNNRAMNGGCCSPLSSATIDGPRKRLSSGLISWTKKEEREREKKLEKEKKGKSRKKKWKNGALCQGTGNFNGDRIIELCVARNDRSLRALRNRKTRVSWCVGSNSLRWELFFFLLLV